MNNLVHATLAGIAIGGFAAAVVEANLIALKALVRLNCVAAETSWAMLEGVVEKMVKEQQQEDSCKNH